MAKTDMLATTATTPIDPSDEFEIEFHVDVIRPEHDLVNYFWFSDEEDMIIGVRRKLGVERTEGLAERIRAFPGTVAKATKDPRDHTALIIAASEEDLRTLVIAARKG
jgi:hypothetical protein